MKTSQCLTDEALMSIQAQVRTCEGMIKQHRESSIPGVKELLTELEQHSSGEFADIESIARVVSIYASAAEQHTIAVGTAILRGTNEPTERLWKEPKSMRLTIPLKAQFDQSFAMNSANNRYEGVSDMAPVEPFNRLIAVIEQSAAFGAPIITNTSIWQIREHMVVWVAFDAQSFTGKKFIEAVRKFSQWLDDATSWAQIPLGKRFDTKKSGRERVAKYPRPADYVPPNEHDLRYLWELDRTYIRVEQGRFLNAALPILKLAWERRHLLTPKAIERMRHECAEEAKNAG